MRSSFVSPKAWPIWALALSAAMLAGAHAFEHLGRMLPCPLCLRQREVFWGAITVAAIGIGLIRFWPSDRLKITVNMILCLVFLTGAVVAGYHTGVEWNWWEGPQSCSGGGAPDMTDNFQGLNLDRKFATVSCSDAAWRWERGNLEHSQRGRGYGMDSSRVRTRRATSGLFLLASTWPDSAQ